MWRPAPGETSPGPAPRAQGNAPRSIRGALDRLDERAGYEALAEADSEGSRSEGDSDGVVGSAGAHELPALGTSDAIADSDDIADSLADAPAPVSVEDEAPAIPDESLADADSEASGDSDAIADSVGHGSHEAFGTAIDSDGLSEARPDESLALSDAIADESLALADAPVSSDELALSEAIALGDSLVGIDGQVEALGDSVGVRIGDAVAPSTEADGLEAELLHATTSRETARAAAAR